MLKHLHARDDWDQKSLSAKGFTLIELLVVIVILGVLAGVVIFAVGAIQERAETNACQTDTKAIKTAIVAWNTDYISDPGNRPTAYPTSMADLTTGADKLLQEASDLHTISGNGTAIPTISKVTGQCGNETITQLT